MSERLIACNADTMEPVSIGSKVISKRGKEAILVACERCNEFRYGGRRSGKVAVRWPGDTFNMEYYDNVFNLIVIDPELEKSISL